MTSASSENIIQNGGFEDTSAGTYVDGKWKPTHWTPYKSDKGASGNGTSVRTTSGSNKIDAAIAGSYTMLMHNDGYYLTQQLASGVMKNFTPYQISYKYRANQSSQAGAKYRFQVGSEEFKSDYYSSSENKAGTTSVQTYTNTFTTPATIVSQPYIQLYRTGYVSNSNNQDIDRFDEFILVAANGGGIGITGAETATFLSGYAYAPEGAFGAATTYDLETTYTTSLVTNGTFDSNKNGWTSTTGAQNDGTASNQTGAFKGKFYENWNSATFTGKMYQTVENIPNGTYKLNICAFVETVDADKGQYVYANGDKSYVYTTTPTAYTVYTYVETNALEFGLKQDAEVTRWMGIDNVSLEYCGADDLTDAGFLSIYNATTSHLDDPNYSNVTGNERTALEEAVEDTPTATADGYATATFNIGYADFVFMAAKTNYDKYADEMANAEKLGVDPIPSLDLSSNYTEKLNALIVLEDAAVTVGFPENITSRLVDSWETSNAADKTATDHWSGTSKTYYNKYKDEGFTMYAKKTITLPAGDYVLKAAARCNKRNEENGYYLSVAVDGSSVIQEFYTAITGDTGKGITTGGTASYDDGTFANEGNGYGWEWRFVGFTLTETKDVELKISANILAKGWVSFSDIQLLATSATEKAVVTKLLNDEITTANAIDKTTNVGSEVFQIPTSAANALGDAIGTAQGVYDATASKTTLQISDAIEALKTAEQTFANVTLNAPAEGQRIRIVNNTSASAFDFSGNALTFYANPSQTEGGYSYQYRLAPNNAYAQNFIFTPVEGQNNQYTMSFIDNEGNTRYVCTQYGYNENASGDKNRIRSTTNSTYALKVRVDVTTTANVWKLYNTEANKNIGTNGKDNNDFFTNADRSDLTLSVASQASVPMNFGTGVKFATRIFPFTPSLPTGVKAYSCSAVDDVDSEYLKLVEVAEPAANVPYILYYAEGGYSGDDLTGWGTATQNSYDAGWLNGVYTDTEAPNGSYVLQKHKKPDSEDFEVAFYQVDTSVAQPTVGAYRCYLSGVDGARALYFNFDETTAVETIQALTAGKNTIYNVTGKVVPSLQKGLNIIKTSDGKIRKVIVK